MEEEDEQIDQKKIIKREKKAGTLKDYIKKKTKII